MKVKFKRAERIAGVFILVAIVGAVTLMLFAAVKKGWFQTKVEFKTQVFSAEGLRAGTHVMISGIHAGEVTDVELLAADKIIVHFNVFEKFHKQIRSDSRVLVVRPFIIGDKNIEITVGNPEEAIVANGEMIESEVAFDMMDLMNGKKLGPFLASLEGLMTNMSVLAKAFADPKRTEAFVKMFDRMEPLLLSMNKMSNEVTKMTGEINEFLPEVRKESPAIGKDLAQLVSQMHILTQTLTPAFKEVGPELPRVSRRAVEALDEMVIMLKAMQKSFLLSGKVKDVKEEERERERKPAGE